MSSVREKVDSVSDWLDVAPTIVAVAILGAALAGFVASRIGDGDHVAVAAVVAFAVLLIVSAGVARRRIRRRAAADAARPG